MQCGVDAQVDTSTPRTTSIVPTSLIAIVTAAERGTHPTATTTTTHNMGSTQREEVFPAPPPYAPQEGPHDSHWNGANAGLAAAPAPPPAPSATAGPATHDGKQGHAHLPHDPQSGPSSGAIYSPPPLAALPPTYEPFSFADEYAADARRRGQPADVKGAAAYGQAPRWHGVPVYHVYHDTASGALSFHLALPATLPPCACSNNFRCQCGRRRPAIWHASKAGLSAKRKVQLLRLSPFSGTSVRTLLASKHALCSSSNLSIRNERGQNVADLTTLAGQKTFTFVDGRRVAWVRRGDRLELLNEQNPYPYAILHTNTAPARLELTAFAWARMPSDELECDFPNCSLRPLFGFVFRCRDCTEQGLDSFDICEAHLGDECLRHDQTHRFERLPRPFGEWDDAVRETPLLYTADLLSQQQSQELVILTLACTLLEKAR